MNVILERKAPYIKPYKGYNQYNNRRLQYIIISNDTPMYQRLYPFYCIISFIMGKRSGGGIIALIWRKKRIKYPRNLDKFQVSHYLLL